MVQMNTMHRTVELPADARRRCIDDCLHAYQACYETVPYCSTMGGRHSDPDHLRLMADCADLCRTTGQFLMRGSMHHDRLCAICAELCSKCADDCEGYDDPQMKACAEACRRCATSCREMVV